MGSGSSQTGLEGSKSGIREAVQGGDLGGPLRRKDRVSMSVALQTKASGGDLLAAPTFCSAQHLKSLFGLLVTVGQTG